MKAECPACKSWTSYIYEVLQGERIYDGREDSCPDCGLPGASIREIAKVRESHASDEVRQQAEAAMLRAGKAEGELAKVRAQLEAAQRMARRIAEGKLDDWDDD
jgi:hypothetical protein